MNSLLRKSVVFAVLVVMAAAGCRAEDNSTGVVIKGRSRRGWLLSSFGSRVTIRRPDGTTTTLGHVGNPFYVIGFIEVPADDPGFIDPRMQDLARQFEVDSVAVVQISLAAEKQILSDEAIEEGNRRPVTPDNLSRFYDPQRLAWEAFGRQESGTILLLDRRGMGALARMKRSLDKPRDIILRIHRIQREWELENSGDFSSDDD